MQKLQDIEEKNPLKQGLKPITIMLQSWEKVIEEKNPLKQGLKLSLPVLSLYVLSN